MKLGLGILAGHVGTQECPPPPAFLRDMLNQAVAPSPETLPPASAPAPAPDFDWTTYIM